MIVRLVRLRSSATGGRDMYPSAPAPLASWTSPQQRRHALCVRPATNEGVGGLVLAPAPDRIPAVDAVAINDPPDCGLSGPVIIIAFDACLTARKTLSPTYQPRYMRLPLLVPPATHLATLTLMVHMN